MVDEKVIGAGNEGDKKAALDPCQFPGNDQAALNQRGNEKIDALLPKPRPSGNSTNTRLLLTRILPERQQSK